MYYDNNPRGEWQYVQCTDGTWRWLYAPPQPFLSPLATGVAILIFLGLIVAAIIESYVGRYGIYAVELAALGFFFRRRIMNLVRRLATRFENR
jgi:hypothetical protein